MKPLPLKIRRNGFTYTQVLRNGRSAIYRQQVTPTEVYHEVFLIRVKPEMELFGKTIAEREVFPSNEEFGSRAWTCHTFELALNKILELNHHKLPAKKDDRSRFSSSSKGHSS